MSVYFVDTSALAKRYLPELGSAWVKGWIRPSAGHTILISALTTVEFASILGRNFRSGVLTHTDFNRAQGSFGLHLHNEYRVIDLDNTILAQARKLVTKHPLRSLDALQLASAVEAASVIGSLPIFVSADKNLLRAAATEGFSTDDPNAHP